MWQELFRGDRMKYPFLYCPVLTSRESHAAFISCRSDPSKIPRALSTTEMGTPHCSLGIIPSVFSFKFTYKGPVRIEQFRTKSENQSNELREST